MFTIFLLASVAILVAIRFSVRHNRPACYVILAVVLFGLPYSAVRLNRHSNALSYLPDALGVTEVAYAKEESWGFGQGGNEAGVLVYPLDEGVAKQIEDEGLAYFARMLPYADQQQRQWRGAYRAWQPTPVPFDAADAARSGLPRFDVFDYICKYGFCIEVDPAVVNDVNAVLNTSGNYYAYGRIGLLVVSPRKRLVVYLYNG